MSLVFYGINKERNAFGFDVLGESKEVEILHVLVFLFLNLG